MSGLVLKLKANEEILINGVRMCNGPRNTRLIVKSPGAKILRLSEALTESDLDSPAARLCHLAQQVVAGVETERGALLPLSDGITALAHAMARPGDAIFLDQALDALRNRNFYGVFRALKKLLPIRDDETDQSLSGRSSRSTGSSEAIR